MRRNVLAAELLFPIALAMAIGVPILELGLFLDWSHEALGVIEMLVGLVVLFIAKPVQSRLAPRLGIPKPRPIADHRKA
jgi:hypothetical protein